MTQSWQKFWFKQIIKDYKSDKESVYSTWFVDTERIKYFGAIKRGVQKVVQDIKENKFPNDLKGSSLEVVVEAISEQRQVFAGASHPWVWKPKLRIPDIYENQDNKRELGEFLETCLRSADEKKLLLALKNLSSQQIKGLGPSLSNVLYFLHPTLFPGFNTAIVNGFNAATNSTIKLGNWDHYFLLRERIIEINTFWNNELSKDLGGISGMFFEIGIGRLRIPAEVMISEGIKFREESLKKVAEKRHSQVKDREVEEKGHTEIQYNLIKLGNSLGYQVCVANNDRSKVSNGEKFSFLTISKIPKLTNNSHDQQTLELIDVIWLKGGKIICAFEIEHSTSIYSGALRLFDLANITKDKVNLFLVASNRREKEILQILRRPTFVEEIAKYKPKYILYDEFCSCFEQIARFSGDWKGLDEIATKF